MSLKNTSWFSFLCGLISLMLCWFFWVPLIGIIITLFTTILALLAIRYGRKVKKRYRTSLDMADPAYLRNARYGRVMGVVGLLLSIICLILSILSTIYFKFLIQ